MNDATPMSCSVTGPRPTFFVVGAPRCGTTALQHWLAQVPGVFVPRGKEFNHFADDLLPPDDPYRDRARWLAEFAGARPDQVVGEASVFHLMSRTAPANLRRFDPAARVVAMVRNPIEVLPSIHAQLVFNGDEPEFDLGTALDLEAARRQGRRLSRFLRFPDKLYYSEVIRFAEQIERWRAVFPDLLVLVHDDVRADARGVFRRVLRHVGASAAQEPSFAVVNANKRVRNRALHRFLHCPSGWLASAGRVAVPRPVARALSRWNTVCAPREPLPTSVQERVRALCEPEIHRLAEVLGRDLKHWLEERA